MAIYVIIISKVNQNLVLNQCMIVLTFNSLTGVKSVYDCFNL